MDLADLVMFYFFIVLSLLFWWKREYFKYFPGIHPWNPYNNSISTVQFSRSVLSNSLWPRGLQHTSLPFPSSSPKVCSNSYPLSWWCYQTISSSVSWFVSCPQSFPASGSFPISQFFTSGGQRIGVSALASVLPMTIQKWFPLGLAGWISLQSKGL